MPFTPFHFGLGLLVKGVAPLRTSFTAFVVSQIAIDTESLYHLVRGQWPVHRIVHTLPVATLVGVLSGVAVWAVAVLSARVFQIDADPMLSAEIDRGSALSGGLIGGLTHPLLDGVMHADIHPFAPLSLQNPLLGLIGVGELHLFCVACGIVGLALLMLRRH